MAKKRGLDGVDLSGKRVLARLDLNAPLKNGVVTDDFRLRAVVTTIEKIRAGGGKAVLMSHLGRPKGKIDPAFSLKHIAPALSALVNAPVKTVDQVVGEEAIQASQALEPGEILLLENLRFDPREKKNDPEFAQELAKLGDIYINDAFGAAHREHASVAAITQYLPAYVGPLMETELTYLSRLEEPQRPYVAVLGGAKIKDKLPILKSLLPRVDKILIGGGMSYTFLRAQGQDVGKSMLDADFLDEVKAFMETPEFAKIELPCDHSVAPVLREDVTVRNLESIPAEGIAGDIGPKTVEKYQKILEGAKTVVWNGPVGAFELTPFSMGTNKLAHVLARLPEEILRIAGGGDVVSAIRSFKLEESFSYLSTGGGAFIEHLCGHTLPGIASLPDA